MEKTKVKEIALKCFQANPNINQITVVSDGNSFTDRNRAAQHAREIGGEHVTITRAEAEAVDAGDTGGNNDPAGGAGNTGNTGNTGGSGSGAGSELGGDNGEAEAEKELKETNVSDIPYDRMKELVVILKIETSDKKKVTLIEALEAKKAELTKPE
ncbi:hypothetical protein SDC9_46850 [bioreactor metagenome]|uniref:Uncharacterized protein n=1 Tax=bioreactor metagenome TaxID=1076179 RepID=A0A644WDI5_9ZZZZ